MSRKKGEDPAERAANLAIRYAELEDAHKVALSEVERLSRWHATAEAAFNEARKENKLMVAEMTEVQRHSRKIDAQADELRNDVRRLRQDLDRCIGFIMALDKKPPVDGLTDAEIPF